MNTSRQAILLTIAFLILPVFAVQPQSGTHLTTVALSDGWDIWKPQTNDRGSVAFGGGRTGVNGRPDSVDLVEDGDFNRLVFVGDTVPGLPGRIFSDFEPPSLNNHDEVLFLARSVPAERADQPCWSRGTQDCGEGLFLYSSGRIRKIAATGDAAPGAAGKVFTIFEAAQLNNEGMVVFQAYAGSETDWGEDGVFLFAGDQIVKVALDGETHPTLGSIQYPRFLTLDDEGGVTLASSRFIARFINGQATRLLASGDPIEGGGTIDNFYLDHVAENRRGELAFQAQPGAAPETVGLFLRHSDGRINRILTDGDPTPVGGTFSLHYHVQLPHSEYTQIFLMHPKLNDAGDVLFRAPVNGAVTAGGLFIYTNGEIRKLVVSGDPAPFDPGQTFVLGYFYGDLPTFRSSFDFNSLGMIVFDANLLDSYKRGFFGIVDGTISPMALLGDTAPQTEGEVLTDANVMGSLEYSDWPFSLNAAGDLVFSATLAGGKFTKGVLRASLPSPEVLNGGFETAGTGGLPEHWETSWSNFGDGNAFQYDSVGTDSYAGDRTLRLHTASSGGATFVLSDPIPVAPGELYLLQCRMRYNLAGDSDSVYFTVIQIDASGNEIAICEVRRGQGDNFWTWEAMQQVIDTVANAAFIRIRFGLIAATEAYLDVDGL